MKKRPKLFLGSTKVPNVIILLLLFAALPASMEAVQLVQENRSKAYSISDPRNPCYPTGCTVLSDGTQVRPSGDIRLKNGTIIKCGDRENINCKNVAPKVVGKEHKVKWWNPFTWFY